jgi:hypothetical protein
MRVWDELIMFRIVFNFLLFMNTVMNSVREQGLDQEPKNTGSLLTSRVTAGFRNSTELQICV